MKLTEEKIGHFRDTVINAITKVSKSDLPLTSELSDAVIQDYYTLLHRYYHASSAGCGWYLLISDSMEKLVSARLACVLAYIRDSRSIRDYFSDRVTN